jgi:hypothetical protein
MLVPVSGAGSSFEQVLVDGANRHRALPGGAGHALDGAVAHVAGREHAGKAGLKRQRRTPQGPGRLGKVAAGQDEPVIVELQQRQGHGRLGFGGDYPAVLPVGVDGFVDQALADQFDGVVFPGMQLPPVLGEF